MALTTSRIPNDIREREVVSDPQLGADEKELTINVPNDKGECHVVADIPTFVKWVLSIEESEVQWARLDADGAVMAVSALIPKGIIKLKGSSRKSNQNNQIVSYGPHK